MENLNEVIDSGKGKLQKLLEKIPGFGGYEKKEDRRDADKIARTTIAKRFTEQWDRISAIERDLSKGMGIIYLGDLESAALKLRRFINTIETASYGYGGWFDAIKVDEIALQQLYDYDLYLFSLCESVSKELDAVEEGAASGEGLEQAIRALNQVAQDCVTALNRRTEVLTGTQNS